MSKVLQKLPTQERSNVNSVSVDKESIIKEVLARVPSSGMKTYQVAPLEKLKKDFLEESKSNILKRIEQLSTDEKKALKYLESRGVEVTNSEVITKCFILKSSGSSSGRISGILSKLVNVEVITKPNSRYKGNLKGLINTLTAFHGATEQEIEQVYNHILMEMLGGENEENS